MEIVQEEVRVELNRLRMLTSSDFSALALVDRHTNRIRWHYASGNGNERYKHIALRTGQGLEGMAVRLGRPVAVDASTPELERIRGQYPIMLAENLLSALAVPLSVNGAIGGVMLIGDRTERIYKPNDMEQVARAGEEIARFID